MKSTKAFLSLSTLVFAVATTIATGDAVAATQDRNLMQNAVGSCQAALPAFEGQIRKRPLALQNEGTSSAFVTCSFSVLTAGLELTATKTSVKIYAASVDGTAHTISCTGVTGYNTGANQYVVKSASLDAAGSQASMTWSGADFPDAPTYIPGAAFSVSCSLAPGVGLNDTHVKFVEDVGA